MAQMNNAWPALNAKEDKHNVFNDGKDRTIRYVEWKDEMKTKARSCAKHHGIKVLMGDMTDVPSGGGGGGEAVWQAGRVAAALCCR